MEIGQFDSLIAVLMNGLGGRCQSCELNCSSVFFPGYVKNLLMLTVTAVPLLFPEGKKKNLPPEQWPVFQNNAN